MFSQLKCTIDKKIEKIGLAWQPNMKFTRMKNMFELKMFHAYEFHLYEKFVNLFRVKKITVTNDKPNALQSQTCFLLYIAF